MNENTKAETCRLDPMLDRALRAEQLAESNGKLAHDTAIKNRDLERQLAKARKLEAMALESLRALKEKYGLGDRHVMREKNAEIEKLKIQRDGLAEALLEMMNGGLEGPTKQAYDMAEQALAALNQPGETKP